LLQATATTMTESSATVLEMLSQCTKKILSRPVSLRTLLAALGGVYESLQEATDVDDATASMTHLTHFIADLTDSPAVCPILTSEEAVACIHALIRFAQQDAMDTQPPICWHLITQMLLTNIDFLHVDATHDYVAILEMVAQQFRVWFERAMDGLNANRGASLDQTAYASFGVTLF
jgi:hypothetical protein